MDGVKWLFFDIGSTLVDESLVYEYRFGGLAEKSGKSTEYIYDKAMEFYRQNKKGDKEVASLLGVEMSGWDTTRERLYPDTEEVLTALHEKYNIGIIANQMYGTEDRLEAFGIRKFIDVVVASAEEGTQKPDRKIFDIAFERAGCTPEEAVMIGDRIDNDIVPAKKLGMKTIWIKQGFGRFWQLSEEEIPDCEVSCLTDLLDLL
ncbi:MAG: HAD family hydrolase [Lachnospiraceae bacterium]|nr:HAD family hydrolase [Lachnospiraceae bacterium]